VAISAFSFVYKDTIWFFIDQLLYPDNRIVLKMNKDGNYNYLKPYYKYFEFVGRKGTLISKSSYLQKIKITVYNRGQSATDL